MKNVLIAFVLLAAPNAQALDLQCKVSRGTSDWYYTINGIDQTFAAKMPAKGAPEYKLLVKRYSVLETEKNKASRLISEFGTDAVTLKLSSKTQPGKKPVYHTAVITVDIPDLTDESKYIQVSLCNTPDDTSLARVAVKTNYDRSACDLAQILEIKKTFDVKCDFPEYK